ncbi:diguanylate cyclase domain-containing protein [Marinobacterium jannaschii]|uniref:diguanylate cyclase domain-containing protein n=1 Tax=Marinobacterium jannaschii TaxID=64970 RepID=UPI0014718155|nr:diguanylate cyclase [Marinobacterium jannaschii]
MNLSLRQLLFATMTLLVLIPIAIFAVWTTDTALDKEFAAVEEKHLLIAKNLTGALNRYAIDVTAVFAAVTDRDSGTAETALQQLLLQFNVHAMSEYDPQGRHLRTHFGDSGYFPDDLRHSQIFDSASAQTRISNVRSESLPEPTLYLVRQSRNRHYWIAAMNTGYLQLIQQAVTFGKLGHAAIVDRAGNILAHPDKRWQESARNIAAIPAVQRMMQGETGVARFYSPAVDAHMIAGFSSVERTGWGVMVPQPVSELYSHALKVRYVTLIVALIALAVSLATSWWLAGRISRPVSQLVTKAAAIAQQQRHQAIAPQPGFQASEINQLLTAFNQMSQQVELGRDQLEQRVEARTAELRKAEQLSRHLARHDVVTGLPNRLAIRQTLSNLLQRQRAFSVLFIDLDGFKSVNDQYGHAVGDQLLQAVAQRIASGLKSTDEVARYGGDEFVVVMHDTTESNVTERAAEETLQRICSPFMLQEHEIHIGACIGIACSEQPVTDIDQLIHLADTAMYRVKHNGKNGISLAQQPAGTS